MNEIFFNKKTMHIRKKCKEKEKTSQIISQHLIEINMTNEMVKQKSDFQQQTKCIDYTSYHQIVQYQHYLKLQQE